ncbi:EIF3M-like protein [Mya arenaria]|uniref:EIF3M-like protein n=1 Tax=Mya arenaria TaxID=6604 RepID=A0ABY7DUX3_MYAAR|nr:EIF3M-like protein [Mya arenaria]
MRVLTFMQMGETKKDIDYESIQKELELNEDEVETKAVQVKIDQMQRKVIITSTTHRTFGRPHWQLLHASLIRWQQNLASVQTNLRALDIMQAQQAQTVQQ